MRRRHVAALLSLAVAASFALPAFGAPSPLELGKRALGVAKKAQKRAKKADQRAKKADQRARDAANSANSADTKAQQALGLLAGPVPSAQFAARAGALDNLILMRTRVAPSFTAPDADVDAARAAATPVPLLERGQLSIYAKCFKNEMPTPRVTAEIYIGSSVDGSVVNSNSVRYEGPNNNDFLDPDVPEDQRRLAGDDSQAGGSPGFGDDPFDQDFHAMAPDGTTLAGTVLIAAREANALAPAGAYGDGDMCMFAGQAFVLN